MGVSSACPYIIDVNDIICTSVLIQMRHFSDVSGLLNRQFNEYYPEAVLLGTWIKILKSADCWSDLRALYVSMEV